MDKYDNNEVAENMDDFSQPEPQHPTLDEVTGNNEVIMPVELKKGMKLITDACGKVVDASVSIQAIGDGIGKFLLNEDGTIRDFTNKAELEAMRKQVNDGIGRIVGYARAMNEAMAATQRRINDAISSWPSEIIAHFDKDDRESLDNLHRDLWWERCIMWTYVMGATIFLCISFGNIIRYDRQKEDMREWLQENAEAINFGRFAKEHLPKSYIIWNQMKEDGQAPGEDDILSEQQKFYLEKELKE